MCASLQPFRELSERLLGTFSQAQRRGLLVGVMLVFDSPLPSHVVPMTSGPLTDEDLIATCGRDIGFAHFWQ